MAEPTKVRLVHEVPAGNQFTGELPDGLERDNRSRGYTKHWTTATKAGVMDPDPSRDYPIVVTRLGIKLDGNTSSWSVTIDDEEVSGADPVLLSGTNEVNIVVTDRFHLVPGQNLKIVTAGATAALSAEIIWDRAALT